MSDLFVLLTAALCSLLIVTMVRICMVQVRVLSGRESELWQARH